MWRRGLAGPVGAPVRLHGGAAGAPAEPTGKPRRACAVRLLLGWPRGSVFVVSSDGQEVFALEIHVNGFHPHKQKS